MWDINVILTKNSTHVVPFYLDRSVDDVLLCFCFFLVSILQTGHLWANTGVVERVVLR